jgi:hypothetical protein
MPDRVELIREIRYWESQTQRLINNNLPPEILRYLLANHRQRIAELQRQLDILAA